MSDNEIEEMSEEEIAKMMKSLRHCPEDCLSYADNGQNSPCFECKEHIVDINEKVVDNER